MFDKLLKLSKAILFLVLSGIGIVIGLWLFMAVLLPWL